MIGDDGWTSPEGFWLARPLLLPDVRSFSDLLEYVREWDHMTMTHTSGVVPQPDLVPEPAKIGDNEIGPFCTIDLAQLGGPKHRSIAVKAKQAVLDVVEPRIVTGDDHLSFQIIGHRDRNRALVILQHGYIIGSHWLAYIDPDTIPPASESSGLDRTKPVSVPPHFTTRCVVCGRGVSTDREPVYPGPKPFTFTCADDAPIAGTEN